MRTFLVECYWPGIESACLRASEFLLQAPSEVKVQALGPRAEMPFDRVVEAIRVGPDS
jgi:hypothetical protein